MTFQQNAGELLRAHQDPPREEWLATVPEPAVEPALPIIDAHHHLWDRPGQEYAAADYLADVATGHNVVASVFVECRTRYLPDGPAELKPLGETWFARQAAEQARPAGSDAGTQVAAGIVGHVDLTLGARVRDILALHQDAAGERFTGVRHVSVWDDDVRVTSPSYPAPPRLLAVPGFRAGFTELARAGLAFDVWCLHPQLAEVAELARAFPCTPIVVDHLGTPVRIGRFQNDRENVFSAWRSAISALAAFPNVYLKIGGLGMATFGAGFSASSRPPGSRELARVFAPWFEAAVEAFGPGRCMFESNFPVDKISYSYVVLWNTFKRLSTGLTNEERLALFGGTAAEAYGLQDWNIATTQQHDSALGSPPHTAPEHSSGSRRS